MHPAEKLGKVYRKDPETLWIEVDKNNIRKTLDSLEHSGARIITISGYDSGRQLEILYHFDLGGRVINLKLKTDRSRPKIGTITRAFPGAELFERELSEMFAVRVEGHPDPRNLFLDSRHSPKAPLRKKPSRKKEVEK